MQHKPESKFNQAMRKYFQTIWAVGATVSAKIKTKEGYFGKASIRYGKLSAGH
jgi:hypothetical protein